jgi:CubicO group peptidase (beta-lactamase class C family)
MSRTILVTTAVLATLALAGAAAAAASVHRTDASGPPGPQAVGTAETIDLDAFAHDIDAALGGHTVGYAYALARNGAVVRSGKGGSRRLAVDGFELPFTPDTLAQAASASKTITAAALIKALHEKGLSVDTRIDRYLPRCWKRGPNVRRLTFRHVLGHHTMLPAGTDCSHHPLRCLLEVVAEGTQTTPSLDNYAYSNTAYALVRVLLPFVLARVQLQATFGLSRSSCEQHVEELNYIVSSRFQEYVLDHVLGPVGVQASFYPPGDGFSDYALNYNNADRSQAGGAPRYDFYLHAGPGYLAISARMYARFLSALDAGLIVPKPLANAMKGVPGNRMGFDTSITGELGEYTWKNGGCPSSNGTKPGCSTLAMVFPNGMQAYVAINSSNNTYNQVCGRLDECLRDAFDDALL